MIKTNDLCPLCSEVAVLDLNDAVICEDCQDILSACRICGSKEKPLNAYDTCVDCEPELDKMFGESDYLD